MSSNSQNMDPGSQRESALFQAASQLQGTARTSFLDAACAGKEELRKRLEGSLGAHEQLERVPPEAVPAGGGTMKVEVREADDEAMGQKIGRYKILEKVGE